MRESVVGARPACEHVRVTASQHDGGLHKAVQGIQIVVTNGRGFLQTYTPVPTPRAYCV